MKLSELVGKRAIRTAPITVQRYEMGYGFMSSGRYVDVPDYSYCSEPVKVLAATDTNAIVLTEDMFIGDEYKRRNISCRYCDDNWTDYDALESTITDESEELGNE